MQENILITGGLGFIGSNLTILLLRKTNHNIIIFDKVTKVGTLDNLPKDPKYKKRVIFVQGDITKKRDVEKVIKKSTIIVHLAALTNAAQSIFFPERFMLTNIKGTLVLLKALEDHEIKKLILLSSSEVYGNKINEKEMDEAHPIDPITPYAVTKFTSEQFAISYYKMKKLPIVILRAFNVYGPYQYPEKMIPTSIVNVMNGKPIKLNNGGKPERDWIFVEDVAEAINKVINYKKYDILGHIFNIGTGRATSIRIIASHILKSLNKDNTYLNIDYSDKTETMGNIGISLKASKILKWRAKTTVRHGIKKTVNWYTHSKWNKK